MSIFRRDQKVTSSRSTGQVFGLPTKCPACNKPGYLDRIDLVDRVMFQHCPWCSMSWQVSEAELVGQEPVPAKR